MRFGPFGAFAIAILLLCAASPANAVPDTPDRIAIQLDQPAILCIDVGVVAFADQEANVDLAGVRERSYQDFRVSLVRDRYAEVVPAFVLEPRLPVARGVPAVTETSPYRSLSAWRPASVRTHRRI
jgi:hypothetical protein